MTSIVAPTTRPQAKRSHHSPSAAQPAITAAKASGLSIIVEAGGSVPQGAALEPVQFMGSDNTPKLGVLTIGFARH
jgi:hypothetical protein